MNPLSGEQIYDYKSTKIERKRTILPIALNTKQQDTCAFYDSPNSTSRSKVANSTRLYHLTIRDIVRLYMDKLIAMVSYFVRSMTIMTWLLRCPLIK